MKRTIKLALLLFGLIFAYHASAQAQDFKLGGGLAYGSEVEAIGIQAGGVYNFTEKINGAADFIIFFPDNYDWWELNVNGHYGFYAKDNVRVYGLAGLNYATLKVDLGQFGSNSESELGLNLGGGAEFGIDFANLYTELKYVIGNADQLAISAGLRFPF
ncbi:outer membrane beta-barrel protein [Fodinibius sp. SL11]|uniref:outer membrane beta-barrel protein n=1 Tax=Fodinibius sp. SL11 TaxID=3425690 RepID=UPI003F8831C6